MNKLITERLILRQWQINDQSAFAQLNADPAVMKFFPKTLSYRESNQLFNKAANLIKLNGWGFWAVELKESANLIGMVGLHYQELTLPKSPFIEIGWRLAANYWRHGYATEAAQAALHYAFTTLQQEMVYAFTAKINTPSQHLMKKLGMKNSQQDFYHPQVMRNNQLAIHCLYQISKKQWQQTVN